MFPSEFQAESTRHWNWLPGFALLMLVAADYLMSAGDLAGGLDAIFDPFIHQVLLETPKGQNSALLVVAGLFLIASAQIKLLGLLAAILVIWAFSGIGHAPNLVFLGSISLALHVSIIVFWAGGLVHILAASDRKRHEVADRFGAIAIIVVPAGLVIGAWIAYQLIGSVVALLTTSYGNVLLAKIALVGGVLLGALKNRSILARSDVAHSNQLLRRVVTAETAIFILVCFATAILTHQPPPAGMP